MSEEWANCRKCAKQVPREELCGGDLCRDCFAEKSNSQRGAEELSRERVSADRHSAQAAQLIRVAVLLAIVTAAMATVFNSTWLLARLARDGDDSAATALVERRDAVDVYDILSRGDPNVGAAMMLQITGDPTPVLAPGVYAYLCRKDLPKELLWPAPADPLARWGEAGTPYISQLLRSGDPDRQSWALSAMGDMAMENPRLLFEPPQAGDLLAACRDRDPDLRASAREVAYLLAEYLAGLTARSDQAPTQAMRDGALGRWIARNVPDYPKDLALGMSWAKLEGDMTEFQVEKALGKPVRRRALPRREEEWDYEYGATAPLRLTLRFDSSGRLTGEGSGTAEPTGPR